MESTSMNQERVARIQNHGEVTTSGPGSTGELLVGGSPGVTGDGAQRQDGLSGSKIDEVARGRNESVTTAVGDDYMATKTLSMDRIETAGDSDGNDEDRGSENHTAGLDQTLKERTHSAKQKLYLHHRHKRGLSKQFTPHSMLHHLHLPGHNSTDEEKPLPDSGVDLKRQESPAPTSWQNIIIMFTTFPYWNMAFWSGWCYSIGSAMFIIDGAWSFVPLKWPETEFEGQSKYCVPLLFFFGACLYQVGGVMAYLEAVNDGCFAGAAMKRLLEGHQDLEKEVLDAKLHTFFGHIVPHHHSEDSDDDDDNRGHDTHQSKDSGVDLKVISKRDSSGKELYSEVKDRVARRGGVDEGPSKQGKIREYLTWRWWPTRHALRTYHVFELGYVACAIQLFGVTLYGVTSIVILPGIFDTLEWWQELAAYWIPQVIASCCFLIASIMFMIMAQDKWYAPKYRAVSWWIGIWAQVGSVGFLLSAVFGLYKEEHEWAEVQSSLSSTWGSFFYMTSGLFQWYEAINVNVGPVLAFPNNRTPVLLRQHHS